MGREDLERLNHVYQTRLRHRLVGQALLVGVVGFHIINEDYEILAVALLALVVNQRLLSAALHVDCYGGFGVERKKEFIGLRVSLVRIRAVVRT